MAREFKTQIKITVGAGAPLDVNSSTEVTNLNVGQLKGSTWASPGSIGSTTPNTGAFTTLTASTSFGVGGTPSAWSGALGYPVQSKNMAMVSSGTDYGYVVNNYYFDGTNYRYVNNGQAAGIYFFSGTDGGGFQFVGFPSGTAGGILPAGTTLLTLGLTGVGIAGTSSTTTRLNIPAGTTGVSSLRVAHGSAPTSPVDGDIWTTTAGLFLRANGSTQGPFVSSSTAAANKDICEFRITLESGVPASVTDQTAKTTIYMTPYKGNNIALYDGASWNIRNTAQISLAVPASTNTMYDLFCYDSGGTPTLEALAWTNDTTRATALTTQDGVLVKSGATTRRYLGSFRTTGTSGQCEDSRAKRYIWNYYNRVRRLLKFSMTTDNWTYTTTLTWRQANADTTAQLDFVIGVEEDTVKAELLVGFVPPAAVNASVGIGLDSTTAPASECLRMFSQVAATITALWEGYPGIGRHYLTWLEYLQSAGTLTCYGDAGGSVYQSGISGSLMG